MDGIEITIKHTLPMQFLYDIMVTMVETPFGEWWHFIDVNRDDDLNILNFTVMDVMDVMDGDTDDISQCERYMITPQKVADVLQRVMGDDNYLGADVQGYIERGVRDSDAGDIDAIAADCLLQVACFDEVVYG